MSNQNTSVIATFADRLGADLLTKFIAAGGVQCSVTACASPGLGAFNVCVRSDLQGTVARLLELIEVARYDDPTSAEVVAGRLLCENVPCCLGGRNTLDRFGFVGGNLGPFTISVPKARLAEAKRILDAPPVSESELTELAMRTAPETDDSI